MRSRQLGALLVAAVATLLRRDVGCVRVASSSQELGAAGWQRRALHDNATIEIIKKNLLEKLGLEKPPDVSKVRMSVEEKRKMIRVYKRSLFHTKTYDHLYEVEDNSDADRRSHSYTSADQITLMHGKQRSAGTDLHLYFNVREKHPPNPRRERIVHSAQLTLFKNRIRLFRKKAANRTNRKIRVDVHRLLLDRNSGKTVRKVVGSKLLPESNLDLETFDVTRLVQTWIDDPNTNTGLVISSPSLDICNVSRCTSCRRKGPLLKFTSYERDILGREKRGADRSCARGGNETRCCKRPIYISFEAIHWDDWVIAPSGYNAFFCKGSCPHRYKVANTFAGIKSTMHMLHPNLIPPSFCVPSKINELPLLHYDHNYKLSVMNYPDMIVEECKCM